ncbi:MAG: helix-turn-helix transcriptional regulator [Clostridium sp.]|nr:helix-turn-helix transcriptional regulator [Acetatifactor muris]MCM1562448.1 helix-turn-helix transcriptional regulator [Clostridium sp.]
MDVNELMGQKAVTKYWLSQNSGVPYTTVCDICNGKTKIENCSVKTVYKIAEALGVSMESLLDFTSERRGNFELYKSSVCHRVKEMGDIDFIIDTLEQDDIRMYYQRGWYRECLYLLAMLDYISRVNSVPVCTSYDDLRCCKLKETLYPSGILTAAFVSGTDAPKTKALQEAIPEFLRFNIVESEVRNVV